MHQRGWCNKTLHSSIMVSSSPSSFVIFCRVFSCQPPHTKHTPNTHFTTDPLTISNNLCRATNYPRITFNNNFKYSTRYGCKGDPYVWRFEMQHGKGLYRNFSGAVVVKISERISHIFVRVFSLYLGITTCTQLHLFQLSADCQKYTLPTSTNCMAYSYRL